MIPKRFTPLDAFLIIMQCATTAFSIPLLFNASPKTVRVYRDSSLIAEYPLSQEKTFRVQGHVGPITIRIDHESVHVVEAGCARQVCMRSGSIDDPFEQIVCAPNHLLIKISTSSKGDTLDAIAR